MFQGSQLAFTCLKSATEGPEEGLKPVASRRCCVFTVNFDQLSQVFFDAEIWKRGSALCQPPWLADEENFRFQNV